MDFGEDNSFLKEWDALSEEREKSHSELAEPTDDRIELGLSLFLNESNEALMLNETSIGAQSSSSAPLLHPNISFGIKPTRKPPSAVILSTEKDSQTLSKTQCILPLFSPVTPVGIAPQLILPPEITNHSTINQRSLPSTSAFNVNAPSSHILTSNDTFLSIIEYLDNLDSIVCELSLVLDRIQSEASPERRSTFLHLLSQNIISSSAKPSSGL